MAEVTAAAVKSLRDRTGAGMMDCKRALQEAAGDEERAIDLLRQRGAAKAAKRAGREANEGAVAIAGADGEGPAAMVELSCETDFVARNEEFVALAERMAEAVRGADLPSGEVIDGDAFLERPEANAVRAELESLRGAIGENLRLRRCVRLARDGGEVIGSYVHFGNRIGVLVELAGAEDGDRTRTVARELAMHVAAAKPSGVRPDDIPEEERDRERAVLTEQARAEGKPEAITDRIVEGRMRKFFEQNALLLQGFVKDPDKRVEALLSEVSPDLSVRRFVRFEVGD